jgi:hypothetical protein
MGVVVIDVREWRAALASQAATQRFLDVLMQRLDEAAGTEGYVGPQMPWHGWADDLDGAS